MDRCPQWLLLVLSLAVGCGAVSLPDGPQQEPYSWRIRHDPCLGKFVSAYLRLEVARLNEVLKEAGIVAPEKRAHVLKVYFSRRGNFMDHGWLEARGRVSPHTFFEIITDESKRTGEAWLPITCPGFTTGDCGWLVDDILEGEASGREFHLPLTGTVEEQPEPER